MSLRLGSQARHHQRTRCSCHLPTDGKRCYLLLICTALAKTKANIGAMESGIPSQLSIVMLVARSVSGSNLKALIYEGKLLTCFVAALGTTTDIDEQ